MAWEISSFSELFIIAKANMERFQYRLPHG